MDFFNPTTPSPPVVTAKVMTGAPVTTSGVKVGAPMDLTGLYTVPIKITNATRSKVRCRCLWRPRPRWCCEEHAVAALVLWCCHSCMTAAKAAAAPVQLPVT